MTTKNELLKTLKKLTEKTDRVFYEKRFNYMNKLELVQKIQLITELISIETQRLKIIENNNITLSHLMLISLSDTLKINDVEISIYNMAKRLNTLAEQIN